MGQIFETKTEIAAARFVVVVDGFGIGAGNRKWRIEVIRKHERHALCGRWRSLGNSFLPRNSSTIIELQITIVFYVILLAADRNRDRTVRERIAGEDERPCAFSIQDDRRDR